MTEPILVIFSIIPAGLGTAFAALVLEGFHSKIKFLYKSQTVDKMEDGIRPKDKFRNMYQDLLAYFIFCHLVTRLCNCSAKVLRILQLPKMKLAQLYKEKRP